MEKKKTVARAKLVRRLDHAVRDPAGPSDMDHNYIVGQRKQRRERLVRKDKENLIQYQPFFWDVIDKCDELAAQEFGRMLLGRALWFCMFVHIYIHSTRHNQTKFRRQKLYSFAENLLDKNNIKEGERVTPENSQMLFDLVAENYDKAGHIRDELEPEEFRDLYYLCINFTDDLDIDMMDEVELDKKKVQKYVEDYYQDMKVLFNFYGKPKNERAYDDPEEDFFYFRLLDGKFPDYYDVFREMGVPESKLQTKIKDPRFWRVYKSVEDQYALAVEATRWQMAKEGNASAQNAVLKTLGDSTPTEKMRKKNKGTSEEMPKSFLDARIGGEVDEGDEVELTDADDKITAD